MHTSHPAVLLPLALTLSACFQVEPPVSIPAFVGTWDCGDRTLVLTTETVDDGKAVVPIRLITSEASNFELWLQNGQRLALVAVTETGMSVASSTGKTQSSCVRVK